MSKCNNITERNKNVTKKMQCSLDKTQKCYNVTFDLLNLLSFCVDNGSVNTKAAIQGCNISYGFKRNNVTDSLNLNKIKRFLCYVSVMLCYIVTFGVKYV